MPTFQSTRFNSALIATATFVLYCIFGICSAEAEFEIIITDMDSATLSQLEELGRRQDLLRSASGTPDEQSRLRNRLGLDQAVELPLRTTRGERVFEFVSTDIRSAAYHSEFAMAGKTVPDPVSTYIFDASDVLGQISGRIVLRVNDSTRERKLQGVLIDEDGSVDVIASAEEARSLSVHRIAEFESTQGMCATPSHSALPQTWEAREPLIELGSSLRVVELATEADWELVSRYGYETNSELLAAVALADAVFKSQLGITLSVVYQHAWFTPQDPYSGTDLGQVLLQLRQHWFSNFQANVAYDSVHLFSGRTKHPGVLGLASLGSICTLPYRGHSVSYFTLQSFDGLGSDLTESANLLGAANVATHELAHVLGASHDSDSSCTSSDNNHIMCPLAGPIFNFSPESIAAVHSLISTSQGACLSSVPGDTGTNLPPTLLPIAGSIIEEGMFGVIYPFLIVDPNGHKLPEFEYGASPLPPEASIKTAHFYGTRYIEYTPPLDAVIGCIDGPQKEFHYTATVTDPTGLSDSEDGVIIVKNKNSAPTLSALAAAPQLQPGETISRTLAASDPDCDDILFVNTYGNAAAFTSFNSANGAFTWRAPDCAAPAQYTLRFVAVDRQGAHSNAIEFPISVAGGGSLNCEADSDGDGVGDNTENTLGTAPDDPGSFAAPLSSPVYALWNGFLGMINILELVNTSSFEQSVTVTLYKGDGSQGGVQSYLVPAQSQFDVILNTMLSGFAADEIGLVKIEFAGSLDGRMFFYRPDAAFGYEFAFGVPLSNPSTRSTAVGFNTFQPSNNPGDSVNIVANWLGLVNLESSPRSFSVYKYNQVGKFLNVTDVTVPPRGRIDIEAGHVNPGSSQVGVNEIHPHDPTTRYLAQLYRYGGDAPAVFAPVTYSFAFPLLSLTPNGQSTSVPISTRFGGENWVELVNPTGSQVGVFVQYLTAAGLSAGTESITLDPHSQLHLFASGRLGAEETGVAVITPTVTNSIVAQSMFYFRDPATGGIRSMYGSQLREAVGTTALGSYNLFLGMESYARLFNSTAAPRAVGVTLRSLGMTLSTHQITIPANGTAELQLHDTATYNTSADSYGVLILEPDLAGSVFADILRVRRNGGALDFVAPTPVR